MLEAVIVYKESAGGCYSIQGECWRLLQCSRRVLEAVIVFKESAGGCYSVQGECWRLL